MRPDPTGSPAADPRRAPDGSRSRSARQAGRFVLALALAASLGCLERWHGDRNHADPSSFTLSVSPSALQVPAGGSGYATATVSRLGGFDGTVTFTLSGAPAGVVAEGSIPAGAGTGRVTFAVAPDVAARSLGTLSLVGQSGSVQASTSFTLEVASALPASTLSPDLVNAAGTVQQVGGTSNLAYAGEPVAHDLSSGPGATVEIRHGFLPDSNPSLP